MPIDYLFKRWKAALEAKRKHYTPQSSEETSHDHLVPLKELYARLETHPKNGLTTAKAESNQAIYGPNCLTPPIVMPKWARFLKNMFEGFSLLLWCGAVLCFLAYAFASNDDNLYLGIVLVIVVVVTGCFTYYQEATSSHIMESFQKMVPRTTTVWRDGRACEVPSAELTKGDLIRIQAGDLIPADIRIIRQQACRVDNSSLTGESEPQSRAVDSSAKIILESRNMAFFGTNCVDGNATGIVLGIGDGSAMGKIANLTANLERGKTPIAKEIDQFIYLITVVAIFLGMAMCVLSAAIGSKLVESIVFCISIIVANVPEGILAIVTVCLTLTAKRMARKNCLVKNLESVETLGSTSVICSDKTGTLTQNRMTVSHLWTGNQFYSTARIKVDSVRVDLCKLGSCVEAMAGLLTLGTNASFCDNDDVPIDRRKALGDASETGILKFLEKNLLPGRKVEDLRNEYKRVFEIPFNSSTKTHLVIHELKKTDAFYIIILKGAPERVLNLTKNVLTDKDVYPVNSRFKSNFERALEYFGGLGERVLGVAFYCLPIDQFPKGFKFNAENPNFPREGLTFAGLVSLIDPPKPGVKMSISKCRDAGIKVAMVTGDHPLTARTIAENIELITTKTFEKPADINFTDLTSIPEIRTKYRSFVMTGADLIEGKTEGLQAVIETFDELVFARTSPEQKLMIVDAFQRKGEIVAVTGDGVNDSPALKKADIGIAMGITGSDVSKQAADMILLDDDFTSIVFAIEEGRVIFENLKKSIAYTLTSNIPEMVPFVLHFAVGIPLPLSTISILCIDLGTDILPAISLAYEAPESDIMSRPPRGDKDRLVGHALIRMAYALVGPVQAAGGMFVYFCVLAEHGFYWRQIFNTRELWNARAGTVVDYFGQEWHYEARMRLQHTVQTAFFAAIVVTQFCDLLICKTRRNSILVQKHNNTLNFALLVECFLASILIYHPGMSTVLHFMPVLLRWWLYAVPWGVIIIVVDEYRRWYIRNFPNSVIKYLTNY